MPVPSKTKQQGNVFLCASGDFWDYVQSVRVIILSLFTAAGEKVTKDIRPGVPFEPTYIYRLLTLIKSSLSEKVLQSLNVSQ